MKLILILSMIIGSACYGQVRVDSTGLIFQRERDTVRCLMLICDTFYGKKPTGFLLIVNDHLVNDSMSVAPNLRVWYDWGYSVREIYKEGEQITSEDGGSVTMIGINGYREHIYYLDKNKQPLSKNIVVWMTK